MWKQAVILVYPSVCLSDVKTAFVSVDMWTWGRAPRLLIGGGKRRGFVFFSLQESDSCF